MSAKLSTRYLTEQDYPAWNAMVAASSEGSIYSTPEYLDVLCSEAGGRFRILAAERNGELAGGIALFERTGPWGSFVSGRYLLYYNGFVLKKPTSKYPSECTSRRTETLSALEEAIGAAQFGRVQVKGRALHDARVLLDRGWRAELSYTYVAPLTDLPALWARMEQNLRRLVTRCKREEVVFTDDDDFQSFFRLHHLTHVRKGAAVYIPEPAFARYFQRLRSQDLCRLFQARTPDGRVMSSQLVLLGKHPVCHTVSAAADPEFLNSGATAFLRWSVFERLASMGYQANDLTDAQLNSVTHFKSQLGGDLVLNLILSAPDRGKFRLHDPFYRYGSLAKNAGRQALQRLKGKS